MVADRPALPPHPTLMQRLVVGVMRLPLASWGWRRVLKGLFGLNLHGLEHVPTRRPLIFVSNHGSHYDGLFLRVITSEVLGARAVPVAWGGVRHFPFARTALEGGAFHVILTKETEPDRTGASQASVLEQMIEHLGEGRSVVLNPEADRQDALARFQPGAAYAALQSGAPIVPLTLRGVQGLWSTLPWPSRWHGRVTAHFHPAIDPASYSHLPRREPVRIMMAEARSRIASQLDYPDSLNPE